MEAIYSFDFAVNDFIARCNNPFLDVIMNFFSFLAHSGWMWILLALVLLCFRRTRSMGVAMAISLCFSVVVTNLTLKPLIGRPRPYELRPELKDRIAPRTRIPSDSSFPSGHTSASFAGATALFGQNKKIGLPALAVATVIAFSRLYFFIHFPTDVLAGLAVGCVGGVIARFATPRLVPLADKIFDRIYGFFGRLFAGKKKKNTHETKED